ncbi:MAG: CGNR zinc finger domain-containing protein [Ilumatobacter sp.]|uniref:CGNR zinc finger domain-containing protein n=1 Tax=Ilumatobacter sp. TaxID=1967498 RepID=UPI0032991047
MSSAHPVDRFGRSLPTCDWPPDRVAPARLEMLRRFCNTTNLESGADRLGDASDFAEWLAEQGHEPFVASPSELRRCIAVREAFRRGAIAHRERRSDLPAMTEVRDLADDVRFVVATDDRALRIVVDPSDAPVQRFIGSLVLAVTSDDAGSGWVRVKACRACQWVVYDHSKNRSAQWCSMSACGGRSKVRQHRARRRSSATNPAGDVEPRHD